jgi:hypothetical protein
MLPAIPLRNFASAVCTISFCSIDIFVSIDEQILKLVPALVMTIERPQRPFGPDLLIEVYFT